MGCLNDGRYGIHIMDMTFFFSLSQNDLFGIPSVSFAFLCISVEFWSLNDERNAVFFIFFLVFDYSQNIQQYTFVRIKKKQRGKDRRARTHNELIISIRILIMYRFLLCCKRSTMYYWLVSRTKQRAHATKLAAHQNRYIYVC